MKKLTSLKPYVADVMPPDRLAPFGVAHVLPQKNGLIGEQFCHAFNDNICKSAGNNQEQWSQHS